MGGLILIGGEEEDCSGIRAGMLGVVGLTRVVGLDVGPGLFAGEKGDWLD